MWRSLTVSLRADPASGVCPTRSSARPTQATTHISGRPPLCRAWPPTCTPLQGVSASARAAPKADPRDTATPSAPLFPARTRQPSERRRSDPPRRSTGPYGPPSCTSLASDGRAHFPECGEARRRLSRARLGAAVGRWGRWRTREEGFPGPRQDEAQAVPSTHCVHDLPVSPGAQTREGETESITSRRALGRSRRALGRRRRAGRDGRRLSQRQEAPQPDEPLNQHQSTRATRGPTQEGPKQQER